MNGRALVYSIQGTRRAFDPSSPPPSLFLSSSSQIKVLFRCGIARFLCALLVVTSRAPASSQQCADQYMEGLVLQGGIGVCCYWFSNFILSHIELSALCKDQLEEKRHTEITAWTASPSVYGPGQYEPSSHRDHNRDLSGTCSTLLQHTLLLGTYLIGWFR